MHFKALYLICLTCINLNARDPFNGKEKKIVKECVLVGTIVGDTSFAQIKKSTGDLMCCVGDALDCWIVEAIDFDHITLINKDGTHKILKIYESVEIGE